MAPFPVALIAFSAIGVRYFDGIFTTGTRWAFLVLLIVSLLPKARFFAGLKSGFGLPTTLYFAWCVCTVIWSQVPDLSLLKSTALILTALAFLSGGYYWASRVPRDESLAYLLPMVLLTLFAGVGGVDADNSMIAVNEEFEIYQGLAGNPNFFGMLIAISFPYALYQAYRSFYHPSSLHGRLFAYGTVAAFGILLLFSGSRASLLCVLTTVFFAVMALTANKKIVLVSALAFAVAGTALIAPQVQESLYSRVLIKGNANGEIFYSRYKPWSDSYSAALQGGYFGLGYGVSAGHKEFQVGLTAETYGREKGNAQLAVWEETGLVGLALYTILLLAMFKTFFRAYRAAQGNGDLRVMLGIVGGAALGMIIESVFEAWWVAPGSMESAGFWAIVGVGAGISRQAVASRRSVKPIAERAIPVGARLLHRAAADKSARST